jgi:hypothetical protein
MDGREQARLLPMDVRGVPPHPVLWTATGLSLAGRAGGAGDVPLVNPTKLRCLGEIFASFRVCYYRRRVSGHRMLRSTPHSRFRAATPLIARPSLFLFPLVVLSSAECVPTVWFKFAQALFETRKVVCKPVLVVAHHGMV